MLTQDDEKTATEKAPERRQPLWARRRSKMTKKKFDDIANELRTGGCDTSVVMAHFDGKMAIDMFGDVDSIVSAVIHVIVEAIRGVEDFDGRQSRLFAATMSLIEYGKTLLATESEEKEERPEQMH